MTIGPHLSAVAPDAESFLCPYGRASGSREMAAGPAVSAPDVAPVGHSWFRLDNAEEYQRHSRCVPFLLAHGWAKEVAVYEKEMLRIVVADIHERRRRSDQAP